MSDVGVVTTVSPLLLALDEASWLVLEASSPDEPFFDVFIEKNVSDRFNVENKYENHITKIELFLRTISISFV